MRALFLPVLVPLLISSTQSSQQADWSSLLLCVSVSPPFLFLPSMSFFSRLSFLDFFRSRLGERDLLSFRRFSSPSGGFSLPPPGLLWLSPLSGLSLSLHPPLAPYSLPNSLRFLTWCCASWRALPSFELQPQPPLELVPPLTQLLPFPCVPTLRGSLPTPTPGCGDRVAAAQSSSPLGRSSPLQSHTGAACL